MAEDAQEGPVQLVVLQYAVPRQRVHVTALAHATKPGVNLPTLRTEPAATDAWILLAERAAQEARP